MNPKIADSAKGQVILDHNYLLFAFNKKVNKVVKYKSNRKALKDFFRVKISNFRNLEKGEINLNYSKE